MAELNAEKTDYPKIAERYDKVRPPPSDIWVSKIIEFGQIEDECSVLDVGCGTGRFSLVIHSSKNSRALRLRIFPTYSRGSSRR